MVSLIEAVGATVIADQDQLSITAPSWRPDLRDPYDYVEEVGRLIGFDGSRRWCRGRRWAGA